MAPGETKRVSITMRNIGFSTWTRADDYKLGSENPQDNKEWGRNRVYLSDGDEVKPGKTKTFAFDIAAPTTPGSKDFQWRMVKDGDNSGWFGDRSINRVIEVTGEQEPPDTSRFGVVAAPGIGDDPSRVDRVQALGVGWVRVAYDWNDMQPTRNGPIQWDLAERIVTRLSDIGVKIYWDFSYAPGWPMDAPLTTGLIAPTHHWTNKIYTTSSTPSSRDSKGVWITGEPGTNQTCRSFIKVVSIALLPANYQRPCAQSETRIRARRSLSASCHPAATLMVGYSEY